MNVLPVFIDDWFSSQAVADMDSIEEAGYFRLLMHAAKLEMQGLPDDERLLANWSRLGAQWYRKTRDKRFRSELTSGEKIKLCFEEEGGRLFNPRVSKCVKDFRDRCEQRHQAAQSKWRSTSDVQDSNRAHHATRSERLTEARKKGTHTTTQFETMANYFENRCVRCNSSDQLVRDHIVPIYQGGSDGIDNIQPLCKRCNSSKGPESTDLRLVANPAAIVDHPEWFKEMPAKCLREKGQTPPVSLGVGVRDQFGSSSSQEERARETIGWPEVVEVASEAGMTVDPSPVSPVAKTWGALPTPEKLQAVRVIRRRIDCGQYGPNAEPRYVPAFRNFIANRLWREGDRPRAGPVAVPAKHPARAGDNLREELRRLKAGRGG